MKRPLLVDQRENDKGDYWVVIRGGNRSVSFTSEMYVSRSNAIRAAKKHIADIDPVPVVFTYWTGDRPRRRNDWRVWGELKRDLNRDLNRTLVTERIR